jgi:hypothetical protein
VAKNSESWGRDKARERYADGGYVPLDQRPATERDRDTGRKALGRAMESEEARSTILRPFARHKIETQSVSDAVPRGKK